MRRFKVIWEAEVAAITPGQAAAQAIRQFQAQFAVHGDDYAHHTEITVVGMDDAHTTEFSPAATEALR
jgi:hypothetical protein